MQDWVLFFNEDQYNFPQVFKHELSTQLSRQFEAKMEYANLFADYFFNLFVGMNDARLESRDGYTFANVDIVSPDSVSRSATIAWNQDEKGAWQFFFCDDLPVDELKAYIAPKRANRDKTFATQIDCARFPDVSLRFGTSSNFTQPEKDAIGAMLQSEGVYVSGFADDTILLDFQSRDFSDAQLSAYFDGFIQNLRAAAFAPKINSVTIE